MYPGDMAGGFLLNNNLFSNPANSSQVGHAFASHASSFAGAARLVATDEPDNSSLGLEADFDHAGPMNSMAKVGPAGPIVGANDPTRNHISSQTDSVGQNGDWCRRCEGDRNAAPTLLLYATGGLAVAESVPRPTSHRRRSVFPEQQCLRWTGSETRTGWTIGAGTRRRRATGA